MAVGVEVVVEDLHGALGAHDGDLRGRPRVVRVAAEVQQCLARLDHTGRSLEQLGGLGEELAALEEREWHLEA